MLGQIAGSMLSAGYFAHSVRKVRQDEVCRRFMTTPSVGAIVAITDRSALASRSPRTPAALRTDAREGPIGRSRASQRSSAEVEVAKRRGNSAPRLPWRASSPSSCTASGWRYDVPVDQDRGSRSMNGLSGHAGYLRSSSRSTP
jgi:hypothetical protein